MTHQIRLTRYMANFVDQVYQSGVRNVVISPGSRSTPLALTFAEYDKFKLWIDIDERSASFFALGIAKKQKEPVVLVCTSGSAAANYYPAIIEAHYSRVPLIVLTADRPHELRDVGAPQAIDQLKLYGDYVKWFHEMALPSDAPKMLNYVRNQADRAVRTAIKPNFGVVHLNFPIQEPLLPDFSIPEIWNHKSSTTIALEPNYRIDQTAVRQLTKMIGNNKKGMLVCGPDDKNGLADAIIRLAEEWNIPVLADPLSNLRNGPHSKSHIIDCYDSILKLPEVRELIDVDFVIRTGAMPISKPYLQLLQEKMDVVHFILEEENGYREPVGLNTHFIYGNPVHLLNELANAEITCDQANLTAWQTWNKTAKAILSDRSNDKELTEGHAVQGIQTAIPNDHIVFVGNSMPIRDMDSFWFAEDKNVEIYANRGTNGIDGIISTAAGMSATGNHTTLLVGDISFLHSMNGLLLARKYQLPLTIVLVNNDGGGIFSFLPQAKQQSPHYELVFGTSQSMDMEKLAIAFDFTYFSAGNWQEYIDSLSRSYEQKGLSIIEIKTVRTQNVLWHQQKWNAIGEKIINQIKGNEDVL
ncbi:2-succinyl-5-enolpyruvyl-6-hydroxy-3-cyclohexene-1-carboxylic-acid synthase [Gracilibacillus oryzae]|uniref:2-succinyl-5-enolpyruvyl-6-hydroxy-3-cyclohexene-1-carboxylate synthase n=1 Tax=Gracilibacillus oryzae TaxID=1672701 RepID=A0A7C8L2U1_9BACI|nr:2-succinyl-5-enolpyruvyl-6-hydroxy-3-cyclohexene-1-carboxylic-acid synthase [Gracilibacillus oryzae]KAB8131470.1 2-succinyl-5-enolpyruvyl-6-hydroxy-3-cyclohexene-1-carboxylic-acid synthase [Gracilibacillus oryzae]